MVTDRRNFLELLAKGALTFGLIDSGISSTSCNEKSNSSKLININSVDYNIQDGIISQSRTKNNQIRLGIMTDIHASKENVKFFAEQLNKENVDMFLLTGDLSWSFGDYEGTMNDYNEIVDVIEPLIRYGKLILTIPGNHEQKKTYKKALEHLTSKYSNIIDMQKIPVADFDNLTIVALGGNNNPRFNVPEGFLLSNEDFERIGELAKRYQASKPLLIATHVPQKYQTNRGLDVIDSGYNVGATDLTKVRRAIGSRFAVSGHIHEAYGIITPDEQPIKDGELSDRLDFNPGALYDHLKRPNLKPAVGILEFKEEKARAFILNR